MSVVPGPTSDGLHEIVVPVVVRDAYRISYERALGMTFVHVQVRKWDAETARRFRADIAAAHALLGEPVYALGEPDAPLQTKFLQRHGFVPCGTARNGRGDTVPVFVRSPDGKPTGLRPEVHFE